LAYCETVIQRNNRLNLPVVGNLASTSIEDAKPMLLDTFFPFDPYRLKASRHFIIEMYREYQGTLEDEDSSDDDDDDEEDEIDDIETMTDLLFQPPNPKRRRINSTGSHHDFDYETSPGFKS
jgi:hypothetical protein